MNPAAHPKPEHCPDCGAELKPGAEWCWLCNYKSPPLPDVKQTQQALPQQRPRTSALVGFVLLAVGFVPACAVAFFVTCLASVGGNFNNFDNALLLGLVGAAVMAVLLIVLMYYLFRVYHRSTLPPELRDAR